MLPFSLKVLRFGKLFPKLYLSAEGLTKICQFLCKVSSVFTSRCAFGDLSLLMTERVFPSLFLQGVAKPSSLETLSPIQVSEGDIQRSQFLNWSTNLSSTVFTLFYPHRISYRGVNLKTLQYQYLTNCQPEARFQAMAAVPSCCRNFSVPQHLASSSTVTSLWKASAVKLFSR